MNKFTRGLIIGGVIGAAIGLTGLKNYDWMQKKVFKPSRRAMRKAGRFMNDMANMM